MDPRQTDANASPLPTASLQHLRARAGVLCRIRRFFEDHGYWEVETPLLSHDICVDAWLEPFEVVSGGSGRLFLQTSPEFHMKRLLAGGADRIFQLTRSFRSGERGPRHNPEFTILEWYAVDETYHEQMDFVEALVRAVAAATLDVAPGAICERPPRLSSAPFRRLRYDDAFAEFAGARALSLRTRELRELALSHQVAVPHSLDPDDRDGWLNLLLSAVVEPSLAKTDALFLLDYPASQSALARVRPEPPAVAERFELYLNGIEICNGYQELRDADELDRRITSQAQRRRLAGLEELPVESRLSDAMRNPGLPECAGVALGVDRLVMWRLGAERLDEVVAFPIDRA